MRLVFSVLVVSAFGPQLAFAEPLTFKGPRRTSIVFPLGGVSFADEVVAATPGERLKPGKTFPGERAVGLPDKKAISLGCGGSLTLRFSDNAVVDVPGPDLYVFEVGPNVEPTLVELSADGTTWVDLGRIEGGTRQLELEGRVQPDEAFHFIRLTDVNDPQKCGKFTPGADIDAVGAMGSAFRLQLSSEVLFESGKAEVGAEGRAALAEVTRAVQRAGRVHLRVLGHTDTEGSTDLNAKLSKARAAAVVEVLKGLEGLEAVPMEARGYGETRPVAPNDTPEGRQKNRRVEVLVIPLP